MAKQQLLWRHLQPSVKPDPKGAAANPTPNLARNPAPNPSTLERKPKKRTSDPSLDEGLRELQACVLEVGKKRMGPIAREADHIVIALRASDDELYYLRVSTRSYLDTPPSCVFVDEKGRSTDAAWPRYDSSGPFRPPTFICTPPTAEFYEYHDERSYDPKDGTLVNTVCTIFAALNGPAYCGRCQPGQAGARNRRRR
jgi:hypothetical protein